MDVKTMRLMAMGFFASCLTTLAFAGNATAQAVSMIATLVLAAPFAYGLWRSPAMEGFARLLAIAVVGTIGFAAWNLLGHPNARWAHRAFIYTTYAAAIAIISLAMVLDIRARSARQAWLIAGGVHLAATASIVLIKMCFVERMMAAAELP